MNKYLRLVVVAVVVFFLRLWVWFRKGKPKNERSRLSVFAAIVVVITFLGGLGFFLRSTAGESLMAAMKEKLSQTVQKTENAMAGEAYAISHIEEAWSEQEEPETVSENELEEPELPMEEETQPLTEDIVKISDIYAEEGTEIIMRSFYPGADVTYRWEQYDSQTQKWESLDSTAGTDELHREVSLCSIAGEKSLSPIVVRCTVVTEEQEYVDVASIYILDKPIQEISADTYAAGTGSYLSAKEIPVSVTYTDGSQEELTGLYGLFWSQEEETIEYSHSISGNMIETVTTTLTDMDYQYVEMGKTETQMHYRSEDKRLKIPITIEGKDLSAPNILKVELGEYEVNIVDEPVPVQVTITAVDDHTMQTDLSYCFLPEGTEPEEKDWQNSSSWEVMISKGGIWTAYVKDDAGNIAASEREIFTVEQKFSTMDISLENTDWCTETKIMVEMADTQGISYTFSCPETGETSGWIEDAEYPVSHNGIWIIQVKDESGNIAEKEISVTNIDKQMPVIHEITVVSTKTKDQGEDE